ncbi:carotenoid 1,2-hydratase [Thioalkalicoccus limnaeus]|uniref:Carotenoid 1,2-hydratase n=1 Tax=Thioalkalicoccus limnaeus TaxID=120681 RepID=A0ABV4BDL5_9GAMM
MTKLARFARTVGLALLISLPWTPPLGADPFAAVVDGRLLSFPEDTGAHPDYRTEWWYITGWLTDDAGHERGFQVTFFRIGTGIGADNPSRFAPRHLILAHAAIADPTNGRLIHAERVERALEPLAGAAQGATRAWIGDWLLALEDEHYHTRIDADGFAFDLILDPPGPPVLNGRAGFSQKTPNPQNASYYYSRPQLAVSGRLSIGGRERPVSGHAWLDHEWSSEILPDEAQGWDWLGINLHDGGSLMAFQMRARDGDELWAAGTLRSGDGRKQILDPDQVRFTPQRHWTSPRTGARYPVAWTIEIDDQTWHVRPLMDDQELDGRRSSGVVYWEGAVFVEDAEREIGRGYLEMTGYLDRPTDL